jgi:transcriptional regulator with XRE-family HTH domain
MSHTARQAAGEIRAGDPTVTSCRQPQNSSPAGICGQGKTMSTVRKGAGKKAPNPIDRHVGSRLRMRRMMLAMGQEKLGDALGVTFQQIQKYEMGTNRISASRLQHSAYILQVPVAFFFEDAPNVPGAAPQVTGKALLPAYVADFLTMSDGIRLAKAFMRIENAMLRRRIVGLVQEVAHEDDA